MAYNRSNGGAAALAKARILTGRPYVFGGTWPESGGTDCSGLWQWAYEQVGVTLPRTTYEQFDFPGTVLEDTVEYEAGDLIFIEGSDPGPNGEPGHVMGYVSPGVVFQAPYTGVTINQYNYDTSVFSYRTRPALLLPAAPVKPIGNPTPEQVAKSGLVALHNTTEAKQAIANGWTLWIWNGAKFVPAPANKPLPQNTVEYANKGWHAARPKPYQP